MEIAQLKALLCAAPCSNTRSLYAAQLAKLLLLRSNTQDLLDIIQLDQYIDTHITVAAKHKLATTHLHNNPAKAITLLNSILHDVPDYMPARLDRGIILLRKHPTKAIEDFDACIQAQYRLMEALEHRAKACAAIRQHQSEQEEYLSDAENQVCSKKRFRELIWGEIMCTKKRRAFDATARIN
jgi:hypothetical protein